MLVRFASLDQPGLVHAVTTRAGGVSAPPHNTLNMSWARPDDPQAVAENRRRVYTALEIDAARVVQAGQIHAADVLVVEGQHAGRGALERASVLPPADAMITREPNIYLLACFADCVPLLFWDPIQRAVGVAHAGWQGTVKHIAAETVDAMSRHFGSAPADLQVVVGPSAGSCCYNVWPHVATAIHAAFPNHSELLVEREDQIYFDLWAANEATLVASGVLPERIEVSGICTIHHAAQFFSHRASGGQTGRFAAVIGMRG